MILRDRDRTVDPCCDNVVGLVSGDLWPAIIFILCFVYFDHNGGSASRDVRDDQDRQQGQQTCMVLPNVTVLLHFSQTCEL